MDDAQQNTQPLISEIDHGDLVSLMRDIASLTTVLSVQAKGPAQSPALDAMPVALPEALALLESQMVRGVQIHYIHENVHYIDTLTPMEKGAYQLVRAQPKWDDDATAEDVTTESQP